MGKVSWVGAGGPLAPFAGGYGAELTRLGYTANSVVTHLVLLGQLNRWLSDVGVDLGELTARRVRELNVYCELVPGDTPWPELEAQSPSGLILSGGPASVYDEGAPQVEAGDDAWQQAWGGAGEGRSGRSLRSCQPALEQCRAVRARQLGMELAGEQTPAVFLQRRHEARPVGRPRGDPTRWAFPQRE